MYIAKDITSRDRCNVTSQTPVVSMTTHLIVLVTKHYIYACKCQNKKLKFINLTTRLFKWQNLKRICAIRNNRFTKYAIKWAAFDVRLQVTDDTKVASEIGASHNITT